MFFVDGIKLDVIRSEQTPIERGVRREGVSFMRFEEGMAINCVVLCMKDITYYRSLAKICPPFLYCTSRIERGVGVYTRITQFYLIIGPPRARKLLSYTPTSGSRRCTQPLI